MGFTGFPSVRGCWNPFSAVVWPHFLPFIFIDHISCSILKNKIKDKPSFLRIWTQNFSHCLSLVQERVKHTPQQSSLLGSGHRVSDEVSFSMSWWFILGIPTGRLSQESPGQPRLHSEFRIRLGYTVRPLFQQTKCQLKSIQKQARWLRRERRLLPSVMTQNCRYFRTGGIQRLNGCAETQVLSAIVPLPYFSLALWSLSFLFEFLFLVLGLDPRSCLIFPFSPRSSPCWARLISLHNWLLYSGLFC